MWLKTLVYSHLIVNSLVVARDDTSASLDFDNAKKIVDKDLVLTTFVASDVEVQLSDEPLVDIDKQHPPLCITVPACVPRAPRPPRALESSLHCNECDKIKSETVESELYVLGGIYAIQHQYPYMVALGYNRDPEENQFSFDCAGTLLSHNYVLTAASYCVDTLDGVQPSIIRAGVAEVTNGPRSADTDVEISEIIRHPSYMRRRKYYDLALLRLSKPLSFSSSLKAVCLDTSTDDPTSPLVVTGWSANGTNRDAPSKIFWKTYVSVVNISTCNQSYDSWRKLPQGIIAEQLCASNSDGSRYTCQAGSGGLLMREDSGSPKLVGVKSFQRGCDNTVPTAYTRVASYLPWIVAHVWPNKN